jgi:hypothetical protein
VKVWSAYAEDEEKLERDDIARNRIIWEGLNPSADWFLCYENGKMIGNEEAVSHEDRISIRHRDEADPEWWHRAMKEATMKVAPPSHWIEDADEEEDDCDEKDINQVEAELRDQVSILKSHCAETKSGLVTWNGQTKQMFFDPFRAVDDLSLQIKKHWGIPKNVYWMEINGAHDWPTESSVIIKVTAWKQGRDGSPFPLTANNAEPGPLSRSKKHSKTEISRSGVQMLSYRMVRVSESKTRLETT